MQPRFPPPDFAEFYDLDHDVTEDLGFYRELARRAGSPVLELGCGTGRVLVELARSGALVHGVDASPNMLAVCRRRVTELGLEDRVALHPGDMAALALPRRDFSLAFAALRTFMFLATPARQARCLRAVHEHLRPGGRLALDLIAPTPERLAELPSASFHPRRRFALPDGRRVTRSQRLVEHDPVRQLRHFEFRFEVFDEADRRLSERIVPLWLRYSLPDELEARLRAAGFVDVALHRDYERNPYDGTGELIAEARRAP